MKTLFVSLVSLAAVSGAALAQGGNNFRDSDTAFGAYSSQRKVQGQALDSNAFTMVKADKEKLTAFQRMNRISEENQFGGNSHGSVNEHGGGNHARH